MHTHTQVVVAVLLDEFTAATSKESVEANTASADKHGKEYEPDILDPVMPLSVPYFPCRDIYVCVIAMCVPIHVCIYESKLQNMSMP